MVREIWQQMALHERGLILMILRQGVGPYLDTATIRGTLDRLGRSVAKEHLDRHLAYLEERGYVRRHQTEAVGMRLTYWEVSADGRDLLMGVTEDPGVGIPDFDAD